MHRHPWEESTRKAGIVEKFNVAQQDDLCIGEDGRKAISMKDLIRCRWIGKRRASLARRGRSRLTEARCARRMEALAWLLFSTSFASSTKTPTHRKDDVSESQTKRTVRIIVVDVSGRNTTMNVKPLLSLEYLRGYIAEALQLPPVCHRLRVGCKRLHDEVRLCDGTTLHVAPHLQGGVGDEGGCCCLPWLSGAWQALAGLDMGPALEDNAETAGDIFAQRTMSSMASCFGPRRGDSSYSLASKFRNELFSNMAESICEEQDADKDGELILDEIRRVGQEVFRRLDIEPPQDHMEIWTKVFNEVDTDKNQSLNSFEAITFAHLSLEAAGFKEFSIDDEVRIVGHGDGKQEGRVLRFDHESDGRWTVTVGLPNGEESKVGCASIVHRMPDVIDYSSKKTLLTAIKKQSIKLVTPKLFFDCEKKAGLPKYQTVSPQYILGASTVDHFEEVEVVAISYCWTTEPHPDPEGYYIGTLAQMFHLFLAGKYDPTEPFRKYSVGAKPTFAKQLRDEGFCFGAGDGRPVAVFLDWVSLPQDKPYGTRTRFENVIFKDLLRNINIWYAHEDTHVWMLTFLTPSARRASYSSSGWTTFERTVGGIISPQYKLLNIDEKARDKLSNGDWDNYLQLSIDIMDQRGPPKTPEEFDAIVDECTFTKQTDSYEIIKPKYKQTFEAVIAEAKVLRYSGLDFDSEKAQALLKIVRSHCVEGKLKGLVLNHNPKISLPLKDWVDTALPFKNFHRLELGKTDVFGDIAIVASLRALAKLNLDGAEKVSGNIADIADLRNLMLLNLAKTQVVGDIAHLAKMEKLTKLSLWHCQVSGDVKSIASLRDLVEVDLGSCKQVIGDISSLSEMVNLVQLELNKTKITGDIANLKDLTKLSTLALPETDVFGDIACLKGMENLSSLWLNDTGVSGSIECFADLKNLTTLHLQCSNVTAPDGCPSQDNLQFENREPTSSCNDLRDFLVSEQRVELLQPLASRGYSWPLA